MTGDCVIQDDCVSTMNYPGQHGNQENCEVTMTKDAFLHPGDVFDLEYCCDHLTIQDVDVESVDAIPMSLSAGETFTWESDFSVSRNGWQICFSDAPRTTTTTIAQTGIPNISHLVLTVKRKRHFIYFVP